MVLFACWLVPVLAAIIIWTVGNSPVEAVYFAALFPFVGLFFGCALLLSDESTGLSTDVLPDMIANHGMAIVILSVLLYASTAVVLLGRAWRRWRKIKALAGVAPTLTQPPASGEVLSAPVPAYVTVQQSTPPSAR